MENLLCSQCPRNCMVNRDKNIGFCGVLNKIKVARAMLHLWEEPCISSKNGSGAIFFSGCPLHCVFCQNSVLSRENFGAEISIDRLVDIFFELESQGANNINLVSPTQFSFEIYKAIEKAKPRLSIPIVYNTSSYEKIETLKRLDGLVDIYLPDLKFKDTTISKEYANCENYFEVASMAIKEMFRQTGKYSLKDEILQQGIIIRHLVLPGTRQDSKDIISWIAENFSNDEILLSLMSQYTPDFYKGDNKNLKRRITSFEYNQVLEKVNEYGLKGYMQAKTSASSVYTPNFNLQGVL